MFIGAINGDVRSVLKQISDGWSGKPIYVGCSGNFTVERILWSLGMREIHGNDVSLYSCYLGNYLAGKDTRITVAEEGMKWVENFMASGIPTIATIMCCTEIMKHYGREEHYHRRMYRAYRDNYETFHSLTMKRVEKGIGETRLASFYAGDVMEFVKAVPDDAIFISFPPTYEGGYEKLYRKIDAVFDWDRPEYTVFDSESFASFMAKLMSKGCWVTLRDEIVPEIEDRVVAVVQTGARARPVYVYSNIKPEAHRITRAHQKTEPVPYRRLTGEISPPISFVMLTRGQMNTLRNEYLNKKIIPADCMVSVGILADGYLIGALGFSQMTPMKSAGTVLGVYMMTDFPVKSERYARLSKLVLAMALTVEMLAILRRAFNREVETIVTTAFTTKSESMKYRGLFNLMSRKENYLQYSAQTGKWTAEEAYKWWIERFSQPLIKSTDD